MNPRHLDHARGLRQSFAAVICAASVLVLSTWAQQPAVPAPTQSAAGKDAGASKPKEPSPKQRREADDAYLEGAKLLDRGDLAGAEARFAKAAELNPENAEYLQAAALAREHRVAELVKQSGKARLLGQAVKSQELLAEAQKLGPTNPLVTQHLDASAAVDSFRPTIEAAADTNKGSPWARSQMTLAGPVTLQPNASRQSFQIRADTRQTIREVLSRYGIQAMFDESLESKNLRFDVDDVTYDQATAVLFEMAGALAVPLDAHSLLIAKDTAENRQRLERQLEETIYLPGLTTAEINELGTIVRTVFDVKQTSIQTSLGSLALRAPEDTLTAVNLTLADLIDGGAEVMLDMRLYTVDRTRQRIIGAQLPQQIGVYNVQSEAQNIVNSNQDLVNQAIAQGLIPADASATTIALALISSGLVSSSLLSNTLGFFGGGITMTGVTTNASTTFNLAMNSSDTRALNSLQLRLGDRQSGTFRSGSRYPIITGSYTTGSGVSTSSQAGTTINGVTVPNQFLGAASAITIPQFQYEDLGLTLKATPTVQRSGLVRMALDLKIEALGGTSINNIPILVNRQYLSDVTVKDGETTLIASSLSRSESAAISGTPGLSELPGFQTAAANNTTEADSSELVLLITPHIVRHRANDATGPRIAYNQRLPN